MLHSLLRILGLSHEELRRGRRRRTQRRCPGGCRAGAGRRIVRGGEGRRLRRMIAGHRTARGHLSEEKGIDLPQSTAPGANTIPFFEILVIDDFQPVSGLSGIGPEGDCSQHRQEQHAHAGWRSTRYHNGGTPPFRHQPRPNSQTEDGSKE